jgi:transcriptional regulator with XRE-family HTH domain
LQRLQTVGARLHWLRGFKGLTLEEFARRVDCDKGYLSKLEHGKAPMPSDRFLARISVGLRVSAPWLKTGEGDPFYPADDERTRRALPQWSEKRVARVLAVLDDLPDALAAGAVVGRLVKGLGLEEVKELAAEIRALPDLPVPARLFWNQLFTDLQLAKLDEWHRDRLGIGCELPGAGSETNELTQGSVIRKFEGVKNEMQNLIGMIRQLTAAPGSKAKLAQFLGVPQARVSEWLAGRYQPGGQITLRLLRWVEQAESTKQRAGSGITQPAPQTHKQGRK